MQITEIDKWPPALQFAALVGAALAGAFLWFRGASKGANTTNVNGDAAKLQRQVDVMQIRIDLEEVVRAARDAMELRMQQIYAQHDAEIEDLKRTVHNLELDLARHRRAD